MNRKTTLYTMTIPGHKRPQLYYQAEDKSDHSLAILKVSAEEFWRVLGRELGIQWIEGAHREGA